MKEDVFMSLPVSGKIYTFECLGAEGMFLNLYYSNGISDGQNVILWEEDGSLEQQWKYNGSKLLTVRNTNFALDKYTVSGSVNNNNADVWTANDPTNQNIVFVATSSGDNIAKIKLASSNMYLTAYGFENGTSGGKTPTSIGNVYWSSSDKGSMQQWICREVGGSVNPEPNNGQKLIYPFQTQYYTVGYKSDALAYLSLGYGTHYANDFYGTSSTVCASGEGKIVGTKYFTSLGNTMAVQYDNVLDHNGENIGSIIIRYSHLNEYLKTSGSVQKGDQLAIQGSSGTGAQGIHVHMEIDTDIDYPLATPSEDGGIDTTLDPLSILYRSSSQTVAPDSDIGESSTDSAGRPWYNISKIRAIPVA